MTEPKRAPLEVGWSSALIPKRPEGGRLLVLKSPTRPAPGRPWLPSPHPSTSPASYTPISPTLLSLHLSLPVLHPSTSLPSDSPAYLPYVRTAKAEAPWPPDSREAGKAW